MKFNDRYDTDEMFAYYDEDPQDGTYFKNQEPPCEVFDPSEDFTYDLDCRHEERKRHAALYICAHRELLKNADYRHAYNKILDEYASDYAYHVLGQPITVVNDAERAFADFVIKSELAAVEKGELQKYKKDAIYIVDWVKSGKDVIVYT